MGDKTTFSAGRQFPNEREVAVKLKERIAINGVDVTTFTQDQVVAINTFAEDLALSLGGDERIRAHVEAQLKLATFSAEVQAFLKEAAFLNAVIETAGWIVETVGEAAVSIGAKALIGLFESALNDL